MSAQEGEQLGFSGLSDFDKGWVVGILDGEGSFTKGGGKYLRVCVEMNDKDTLERLKSLLGWTNKISTRSRKSRSKKGEYYDPNYACQVNGWPAQLLMIDVFPFMSKRRKLRIQELILEYGR